MIGRTGKILGCRALLLLHDAAGHPLFATTHRGDLHLTKGASAFLERYELATESSTLTRLIIDREGMAAEFLAALVAQGRTIVTILHANQYQGLASFTEVGDFVPLCRDRDGAVTREVASARFALPLPDHERHRRCRLQWPSFVIGAPRCLWSPHQRSLLISSSGMPIEIGGALAVVEARLGCHSNTSGSH